MHNLSQRIHFNMAFIGGYLGVHAILSFSNLLGNAQTSNLISMVTSLLSGDWQQLLQRIGGMLLYMAAIARRCICRPGCTGTCGSSAWRWMRRPCLALPPWASSSSSAQKGHSL